MKNIIVLIILLILISTGKAFSQDSIKTNPGNVEKEYDVKDLLRDIFGSKKKSKTILDTLDLLKTKNDFSLSVLPGVSYNPATDFVLGVSVSMSWYLGDKINTTNSSISTAFSITTKNQVKLSGQANIFTNKNNWVIGSEVRFWKYVQNTYGLGTNTKSDDDQNMDFNFLKIQASFSKKIVKNLYAGLGYSLQSYNKISTVNPDNDSLIYPNYNNTYSAEYNIDSSGYVSSGFFVTANYDSRDNTINAYRGIFTDANYYNFNKWLGSTVNWQAFECQFRAYQPWNKKNTFITAFWVYTGFGMTGNGPYMSLYSNGWDKYNTTGRGYVQGRFRGKDIFYWEIENRITLTRNRFFGIVIFANAITASNPENGVGLFDYIAPTGGIGLRFLFDKNSRTNLCVDFGIGEGGSSGVFLNLGEFF